ncbi:MAG: AMP-binding protein [Minwuia sp.]|uniref:AMP-binding protein n=1 Tax=Minwuia sp. TaxID=2493630 RepID=UPI003A898998
MTNRLTDTLLRHFADRPADRAASFVTAGGRTDLSFGDVAADCRRFAAAYNERIAGSGGTVLIFLRHVPELYGSFYGAMLAGHVPSLMPCTSPRQDPKLYWQSHNKLLARIRPAAIVADRATFAEMAAAGLETGEAALIEVETVGARGTDAAFAPRGVDEVALLQHSSGTTGLKKGVRLSYDAILRHVDSYAAALKADGEDRVVSWLPLYHDMGLIACMVTPIVLGLPVTHIDPFHWLTRPGMLLSLLTEERGTLCWLPNFAFEHLALTAGRHAAGYDLGHVRAFVNCSEPCKPGTFDRFAAAFQPAGVRQDQLQCCYAMAETVFAVSQTPMGQPPQRLSLDADRLRTDARAEPAGDGAQVLEVIESGVVLDGLSVEIRDATRKALPERQVGEIAIAGTYLFDGYNEEPERTAERLEGGYYHTGDRGFMVDGRLYVLGRNDDLMIINGRNIYAHEAEAELAGIEGLKPGRSVVLAHEDPKVGSQVMIVIAEREVGTGRADADVRRDVSDRLFSIFQVMPRAVELVDQGWLIKTTSGKIGRAANLQKFLDRPGKV